MEEQVEHEGEDNDVPPSSPSDFVPDLGWDIADPYHDLGEDRRFASHPIPATVDSLGRVIETFPGTSMNFEQGETFLTWFNSDPYAVYQKHNLYYPFTSLDNWKMANFLLMSKLSMNTINNFLSLQAVRSTGCLSSCI